MLKSNTKWLAMVAVVAFGCGGGDGADASADAGGDAAEGQAAAEMAPAGSASVSGTISFAGTAPAGTPIDMSEEPACAEKHASGAMVYSVRVGDGGGLADVFVYVKEGLEGQSFAVPTTAVVLDQDGCEYRPHVLGVMAGQDLTIRNSDPVLHNINTQPTENRGFNVSQPRQGMESSRSFSTPEVMIPVKCDVHGWMNAYIGVTSHPYHATTGDDGSFTISGLPAGDYVIEAWHPTLGASTMSVTVGDGEAGTADFSFSEGMAASVPMGEPVDLMHPEGHAAG